ncbi:globin [Paracrocinitomix mangrovi]|uniref:globin domain-containing protein n=1 Tax=Paracrocinitomix mangrovi TaxID=2862509 RepID=UPI001C8E7934|nr:globin [Paracrocinitomix mangrovi]UKN03536.1 globin [Paracrocinitomix mangrovi]
MNNIITIYEKLGDEKLKQLLDAFYDRVFASEIIGPLFNHTEKDLIKDKQFCFLTQFLGGPPRYIEKYGHPRMRMRHMPHKITMEGRDEWLRLMKESINTLEIEEDFKEALYNCFPKLATHMVNS